MNHEDAKRQADLSAAAVDETISSNHVEIVMIAGEFFVKFEYQDDELYKNIVSSKLRNTPF